MAVSKQYKTFEYESGKVGQFAPIKFRTYVKDYKQVHQNKGEKLTLDDIYNRISDYVNKSPEAIRNWYRGYNGPSDFEDIKILADFLSVDSDDLLASPNINDSSTNAVFNASYTSEKAIIDELHHILTDFIYTFAGTMEDCLAYLKYDNPDDEQGIYVMNMYKYLDQSSLFISDEVYKKLRALITQTNQVAGKCGHHGWHIPQRWIDINPLLKEFNDYQSWSKCYMYELEDEDVECVYHMLIEDIPDIVEECNYYKTNWIEDMKRANGRSENDFKNWDEYKKPLTHAAYDWTSVGYYPEIHECIVKELSYTLSLLVKNDFPEYFLI